ncbi:FmdB family transcriptional regulator [Phycicoccus endophyticus]|uniref:FmdB family transcriptional regulator n=1 Tax=Phycicoccus endophyticus TaxID=1690220 RepID=A0A7G9R2A9_9MICO|nr:FmdB family zinc ribbon protein [Phycicoccus endophyticus]NHI19597.1 FmdB family transcriptional regulator [Phycicoccus endophyticus]QNN49734.1 FmdB family transcriptional regulator [Phycicoccus endophyticus]GGL34587.1 hypothetical protein GCM10012283_16320 [Phycicoccus endophyticus]
MPTYAYACTACDHRFEVVQSFSDDALTECPECGGRLRKVFNAVGIVFKGGGFYRTDSRSASSGSTAGGSSTGSAGSSAERSSGSGSSGSGSSEGSGSTPAASSTGGTSGGASSTGAA